MADVNNTRPDTVGSAAASAASSQQSPFDETEYQALRQRYLEKRVRTNVELPGGRCLRTQTAAPVIEINTPGYRELHGEIKRLERQSNHAAIYVLLQRLAQWDMRRLAKFPTVSEKNKNGVVEVVDLTVDDEEDRQIIDVDKYILEEVLLLKVIKPDPDASATFALRTSENNEAYASGRVCIKTEPLDEDRKVATTGEDDNSITMDKETITLSIKHGKKRTEDDDDHDESIPFYPRYKRWRYRSRGGSEKAAGKSPESTRQSLVLPGLGPVIRR